MLSQRSSKMNTKYNNSISCASVAILICLLASGISKTNAVPTDSLGSESVVRPQLLLHRALRDVALMAANLMVDEPKDATSTEATLDQPQGQCLLDGVLVSETTVFCEKQVGCRAIQKTGHCCPDYKCDCEKDGKTYMNGDKLVDPETPCTVCYCQGGEILCSSVSCFHRDDCTPKYIPGQCCPEYDNCPVSKTVATPTVNNSSVEVSTSAPIARQEQRDSALFSKITIKEITKPIEIRITDDNKAISIHQMLKPSTTEGPTSTLTATSSTPSIANAATSTDNGESSQWNSATLSNKPKAVGGINIESLKLTASTAYDKTQSAAAVVSPFTATHGNRSQEFAEVEAPKDNSSGEKPISVFGSQELQRVEGDAANGSSKVNIKREYFLSTEDLSGAASVTRPEKIDSTELVFPTLEALENYLGSSQKNLTAGGDADTAGSDNIYRIILTTDGPRLSSSTERYMTQKGSSPEDVELDPSAVAFNDTGPIEQVEFSNVSTEDPEGNQMSTMDTRNLGTHPSASLNTIDTDSPAMSSPSDFMSSTTETMHHMDDDDGAMPMESNPAYPSLPEDDFSLRDVSFPLSETDDIAEVDIKDEPRSISSLYDTQIPTKLLEENEFNNVDGSGGGIEVFAASSTSVVSDTNVSSSTESPEKMIEVVELMNSAEDSSAETSISNSTDFQLEKFRKDSENETGSGDSLETDGMEMFIETMGSGSGSGGGSGSGEIMGIAGSTNNHMKIKPREPTTPRPTRQSLTDLDLDELGSASGDGKLTTVEDPKLDVESLKLDETGDDDLAKPETMSKGNILAIKINSPQDKTIEESDSVALIGDDNDIGRVQRLYLHRIF